jgi:hypothetical protein
LLLGAFCPRSVPLLSIVRPAPTAADFSKSRLFMMCSPMRGATETQVSRFTGGSKGASARRRAFLPPRGLGSASFQFYLELMKGPIAFLLMAFQES